MNENDLDAASRPFSSPALRGSSAAPAAPAPRPPRLHLLALNPTDSVTEGFLPAAARLGLAVTLLTDQPEAHERAYGRRGGDGAAPHPFPALDIVPCDVRDFAEVISRIAAVDGRHPRAVFTNSDHLQAQAALAAQYFGLPGKDWRAALRTKNKAELRRALAAAGPDVADPVWAAELATGQDPATLAGLDDAPYPCVVKPREGVASEDVVLVADADELVRRCAEIRERRPGAALVVEEFLDGELRTLETLGDGRTLHVLGAFRTELSPPPHFIEERLHLLPAPPPQPHTDQVLAQLRALGVGFGVCHTEYVVQGDRARLIEVNYRAIGDQCDLVLAELLGIPLFEHILRTHLGEPLPDDLGARTDGRVRMEYVMADRAGRLASAPPASVTERDGVRLDYRPLRGIGEEHPLHRTNRDFLGVLRATGTDQGRIDTAVARFLAAHRWEIV
ncbi:acetyl-CoA carboxylase biotin carboxylase subunit family protein [Streptomyces sp. 5-10]|uniref:ATP-grasp domain-containing protein n=1 Tax=Streptomyces sp. 5-10 TaxID=878925 RepID=UPI00168BCC8C|nr:ATP-grasp domain-containing protein [Streptomyces sp. 5-10]MBD3005245.1 ATP-grasp domain-containing protein [Streptomyces sp. 5-10]